MTLPRLLAPTLLLPALALLAGCGPADGLNRGGQLTGKVSLNGRPLGGGRVEIFSQDGKNSVSAELRPDSTYTLKEPPLGDCKLTVATSQLQGLVRPPAAAGRGPAGGGAGSAGMVYPADVGLAYTPIPARYESLTTTDLTVTVKRQKEPQTHDIDLKPR